MNRLIKHHITENAFKKAHVYPHIEDIMLNTAYALTVNPSKDYANYMEFQHDMSELLSLFRGKSRMYPELSTETQRWHLHGEIIFKTTFDVFYFYQNIANLKEICTFKLRPIDTDDPIDSIQWYLYQRKQKHVIKPFVQTVYHGKIDYVTSH